MQPLHTARVSTEYGEKAIELYCCDILNFDEKIDILTTSAFAGSYEPVHGTMFEALYRVGISVRNHALNPYFDLRKNCHIWLSEKIDNPNVCFSRLGCVEMRGYGFHSDDQSILDTIKAYFAMLSLACVCGVKAETVALPLLGTGSQGISDSLVIIPLINECISFLKNNEAVKKICFIERSPEKANRICEYIKNSYNLLAQEKAPEPEEPKKLPQAFISYSSLDRNIADNLCAKLESRGVKVWYAPRNVNGPYAGAIVKAINESSYFIVILSQNSMSSQHVLNEIDLAFKNLPNKIKFKPLRIDDSAMDDSFRYYLSRQHWMDAIDPPLEEHLTRFVDEIIKEI